MQFARFMGCLAAVLAVSVCARSASADEPAPTPAPAPAPTAPATTPAPVTAPAPAAPAITAPAPAAPTPHDRAVAAFTEARKSIDAGDCPAALPKLQESLAIEPSVGARLSMADCLDRADPVAAWSYLRDAALVARANKDDRLDGIVTRAAALARTLPAVSFDLAPADADLPRLEVLVDGVSVPRQLLSWPAYVVTEGEHVVEVSAPGRKSYKARVSATPRVVARIKPVLEPAEPPRPLVTAAPPPPVVVRAPDPGAGRRTAGLALAASGLGALTLGAAFGVLTLNKNSEVERACGGDVTRCTGSPSDVEALRESASTLGSLTWASVAVGGVLVAGGGVLFFTAPRGVPAEAARSTAPSAPNVRVGLGRVMVEGAW
jgi:hypothetical protein